MDPLPCVPLLIEHSTPKGEPRPGHKVGRGQGHLSEALEGAGEEGAKGLGDSQAVAPLLCKVELGAIS